MTHLPDATATDHRASELQARFDESMAAVGPFEPAPLLAVAVSGGADSLALTLLADRWARARDGSVLALIVDHGLRPASSSEMVATLTRLTGRGIAARGLRITGLAPGPGIAARARAARYEALFAACTREGCLHLLLGHHRADQAETVMMRVLRDSRSAGLSAMPAISEHSRLRLLRPLLAIAPETLRGFLRAEGLCWVTDPSNRDRRALRTRLRPAAALAATDLARAACDAADSRARADRAVAEVLAERVMLRPEGFAVLSPGRIAPDALAAVLQALAGAPFPLPSAGVERLAARPGPTTIGGVRVMAAGRLGSGWLLLREAAAMAPSVPAAPGAIWDGRFQLRGEVPDDVDLGPLGAEAARFRHRAGLPSAVLQTLPALRRDNMLVAVPHLGYTGGWAYAGAKLYFSPPRPIAGALFAGIGRCELPSPTGLGGARRPCAPHVDAESRQIAPVPGIRRPMFGPMNVSLTR